MGLLIKAGDLKGLFSLDEAIEAVEKGFADLGEVPTFSLPRQRMLAQDRRLTVHSGGCLRLGVAGSFIHYERFRYTRESQSYAGAGKRVYVTYDSENAQLLTIIVGSLPLFDFDSEEDSFATETPLTSAVGTKYLARRDARVLGLFGTGRQARRHLQTMCAIRPIERVNVFSPNTQHRTEFCELMCQYVDAEVVAVREPREVVRGADIVVCATNTNVPVLYGDWLEPGTHVTSIVGSNKELLAEGLVNRPRRELDDRVLAKADVLVVTLVQQAIQDQQGDLLEPVQRGLFGWEKAQELGTLVSGKIPGRTDDRQITVFKQNSDQGVGFMALAKLAYEKARKAGVGIEI